MTLAFCNKNAGDPSWTLLSKVFLASALLATSASAGGSWDRVRVLKLSRTSASSYTLVVEPLRSKDPLFGGCRRFEVHGTLRRLEGEWPIGGRSGGPSREEHIAALKHLRSYEGASKPVNFGWIGSGFKVIDLKNPCIVESRGLQVIDGAVVSYFHTV